MKETKEILLADYDDVSEKLKCLDKDDNAYKQLLDDRKSIRDELVKMEEIEYGKKKDKIRNIIDVGIFTVTTASSIMMFSRTLKFDESATITSTVGRGLISDAVLKMFKK